MGRLVIREDELGQLMAEHDLAIAQLEELWEKIRKNVSTLEEAWEGDAASAFFEEFYSMETPMQKTFEVIQQERDIISQIRQQMMDTETQIVAAISAMQP